MENQNQNTNAMTDMAIAILDKLTGLNAEFSFDFENMEVKLPAKANGPETQLKVNGTLRIKTRSNKNQL